MNSKDFSQIKHILSSCLNSNTKVIDMCCGDTCFYDWIKKTDLAKIVPMSPENMEHISHENPFVAYNNFINDERKVPVEDKKADTVLLLGPLYLQQTPEKRVETVKEIKRLVKDNGTVITISDNSTHIKDYKSPEYISIDKTEKEVLTEAGFTVEKSIDLPPVKTIRFKSSSTEKPFFTVNIAKITPAIRSDAIPPEVILQIPKDVLDTLNIEKSDTKESEIRKSIDLNLNSDKELTIVENSDNSVETKHTEVKQSIDISLQKREVIHKSIDPTLQPKTVITEETESVKLDLPILPKEITDLYDNSLKENTDIKNSDNNSKTEITDNVIEEIPFSEETEIPEIPEIPIRPSIDKNLIVRENKEEIMRQHSGIEDFAKVHDSIDKTLQMNIPKINPRYAKPKSKKKGTRNLFKNDLIKRV